MNSSEQQVLYNLYEHRRVYEVWYVHLARVTGLCKVGNVGMQFCCSVHICHLMSTLFPSLKLNQLP